MKSDPELREIVQKLDGVMKGLQECIFAYDVIVVDRNIQFLFAVIYFKDQQKKIELIITNWKDTFDRIPNSQEIINELDDLMF